METKTSATRSTPCLQVSTFALISFLLIFISNIHTSLGITPTKASQATYNNYLKTACNSTTYPKLCYSTLSPYSSTIKTNNLKLCNAALTITLKAASNTSTIVKTLSKQKGLKKSEVAVIKDCLEEIRESIDELKQALKALKNLKGASDVEFQIQNIKTWVSAAITDDNTCTDGFEGMKVSSKLRSRIKNGILNGIRLTSNALALINKLTY